MWEKIIKYLILFLIGVLLFIVIHKVYKKCIDGFNVGAQPTQPTQPQIEDANMTFDDYKNIRILDDTNFNHKVNDSLLVVNLSVGIGVEDELITSGNLLVSAQKIFNFYNTPSNNPFEAYFDKIVGILDNGLIEDTGNMNYISINLDSFTFGFQNLNSANL